MKSKIVTSMIVAALTQANAIGGALETCVLGGVTFMPGSIRWNCGSYPDCGGTYSIIWLTGCNSCTSAFDICYDFTATVCSSRSFIYGCKPVPSAESGGGCTFDFTNVIWASAPTITPNPCP